MEKAVLFEGFLNIDKYSFISEHKCRYALSVSGELSLLITNDEGSTFLSSLMEKFGFQSTTTEAEIKPELVLTSRTIFSRNSERSAFRFSIEIPGERTLFFRAPSLYEADAWDTAIHNVIDLLGVKENENGSSLSTMKPLKILDDVTGSGWYKMPCDKMGFYVKDDNGQWFILNMRDIDDNFELEMPPEVNNNKFSKVSVAIRAASIAVHAAQSIHSFDPILAICNEALVLFESYRSQEENCVNLIRTCEHMKETLMHFETIIKNNPGLRNEIDMHSISECKKYMANILASANMHMNSGEFSRFVNAAETEKSLDETLKYLKLSMSSLSLGMAVVLIGDTQRIMKTMDEFRDLLLGRVKENNMIHDDTKKNITDKLEEFQSISEEAKFNSAPIEVGDNFKVYDVMYDGKMSTAKVYKLDTLNEEDSRKILMMFMKELLILQQLKYERIIVFYGCSSTNKENRLFFEHMEMGSLRSLLDKEEVWVTLNAKQRYRIIRDIADGMLWLHRENIAHRSLSSLNVLLSKDFRVKLSGFGFSKTTGSLATISQNTFAKNYRWLAPEGFTDKVRFESDLYSFGIVCWEVFTGILGKEKSFPWGKMAAVKIIEAVVRNKERPMLPDDCVTDTNVHHADIVKAQMGKCLKDAPCDRPSFYDVFRALPSN